MMLLLCDAGIISGNYKMMARNLLFHSRWFNGGKDCASRTDL